MDDPIRNIDMVIEGSALDDADIWAIQGYVGDLQEQWKNRAEQAEREREIILNEARTWAQEARTQRRTVQEVGSALGGVPDWGRIAGGVRDIIEERDALRAEVERLRALAYMPDEHGDPSEETYKDESLQMANLADAEMRKAEDLRARLARAEAVCEAAHLYAEALERSRGAIDWQKWDETAAERLALLMADVSKWRASSGEEASGGENA